MGVGELNPSRNYSLSPLPYLAGIIDGLSFPPDPLEDHNTSSTPVVWSPALLGAVLRQQNLHKGSSASGGGPNDPGPVTRWWGPSDHLDFNRYDSPPGHSRGPEDRNTFSALVLTPEQAAAIFSQVAPRLSATEGAAGRPSPR